MNFHGFRRKISSDLTGTETFKGSLIRECVHSGSAVISGISGK